MLKSRKDRLILTIIFIIYFTALSLFFLFFPGIYTNLNDEIIDSLYQLRFDIQQRGKNDPDIVHINFKESSFEHFGASASQKELFNEILFELSDLGTRAIVVDHTLRDKLPVRSLGETEIYENLYYPVLFRPVECLKYDSSGDTLGVFLARGEFWYPHIVRPGDPPILKCVVDPSLPFIFPAKGVGHISYSRDKAGHARSIPLFFKHFDAYFPSLAFHAVSDYLSVDTSTIEVSFGKHVLLPGARFPDGSLKDISIPIDRKGRMLITPPGLWEDYYKSYSFEEILTKKYSRIYNRELQDSLNGSIAIVSDISILNKETEPGIYGKFYPLSALLANQINTILTEDFLYKNRGIHFLFLTLLFLALWFYSLFLKPFHFILLSITTFFLVVLLSLSLFIYSNILPELGTISLDFIPLFLIILVIRVIMEENDKKILEIKYRAGSEIEGLNKRLIIRQEELEQANSQLKEQDQYKSLFFQNISHDLKTPLTLILDPLDYWMRERRDDLSYSQKQLFTRIYHNAGKVLSFINQILNLSKLEAGKIKCYFKSVNITTLLESILASFKPAFANKGIRAIFNPGDEPIQLYIDPEKIERALSNILINAYKYCSPGEEVKVVISPHMIMEGNVEYCKVLIRDTGPGISREELPYIFERFHTTKPGAGLGLTIAAEFIKLHSGKILVDSKPGQGTEFTILLPHGTGHLQEQTPAPGGESLLLFHEEAPLFTSKKKIAALAQNSAQTELLKKCCRDEFIITGLLSVTGLKKILKTDPPDLLLIEISFVHGKQEEPGFIESLSPVPYLYISFKEDEKEPYDRFVITSGEQGHKLVETIYTIIELHQTTHLTGALKKSGTKDIIYEKGTCPAAPILVVDDDLNLLEYYNLVLGNNGLDNLILCSNSKKVMDILSSREISLVILDLYMPYSLPGYRVLTDVKENYSHIPVIIASGLQDVETAIECLKKGASDYIIKPVETGRLLNSIRQLLKTRSLEREIHRIEEEMQLPALSHPGYFSGIITKDPGMMKIFKYIEIIGENDYPVIITGETGTGKELIARAIHQISSREGEFVSLNAAGLDDTFFSDTLFGHTRGAYSGAGKDRAGLIKKAEKGTLFLDEIGDLSLTSQVKLLHLVQDRTYYPLGADTQKRSGTRIIAATNVDLKKKIRDKTFREDLYFRFSHKIHLPPLRERCDEDLVLLVNHFVKQYSPDKQIGAPLEVLHLLKNYEFYGNIRELEELVKNAISLTTGENLPIEPVKKYITEHTRWEEDHTVIANSVMRLATTAGELPTIAQVKKYLIEEALKQSGGNQSAAAKILGISQSTLSKLQKKG